LKKECQVTPEEFEDMKVDELLKVYAREGNVKLVKQYIGTRKAIMDLAVDKVREFIGTADVGLDAESRDLLAIMIARSMVQSFSLGYGIGKIEGKTDKQIYL
jgi:hypothetical protein